MFKDRLYIFLPYTFFFISSFLLVIDAGIDRHWSSVSDQDLILVYNSLALRSDLYNDYVDHPGYSTILLISLWWDFLNLIGVSNVGNIYELATIPDLKTQFQNLFVYARLMNIFLIFFLVTAIFKIIHHITKNRIGSCILTLAFIFSFTIIEIAGMLRTEVLSVICLFLFFYFLIKFCEDTSKFRFYLMLLGSVFILGVFAKMQFLIVIVFFPIIFFYFFKPQNKIRLNLFFYENKKIILFSNIIFFLLIGLIWQRYAVGMLNKLFIPFILIYFFIICFVFKYHFLISFRSLNAYLAYFFGGQGLTMIFFYFYKKFSMLNIIVLVNMPGWISRFQNEVPINAFDFTLSNCIDLFKSHSVNLLEFLKLYFFNPFTFEFILLLVYLFVLLKILFISKFNINTLIKYSIYLFAFIIVSIIFSIRTQPFYLLYVVPLLLIGLSVTVNFDKYFKIKKNFIFISILMLFFSLINFNERKSYDYENWNWACRSPKFIQQVWLPKMDLNLFKKICDFGVY
jgi:hypothetical protein|tara:strand:- start:804 stop:2339 length:1536 start_codon:yes stop_codon:yes gene_type:complete